MDYSKVKRCRAANFTNEEVHRLVELVEKHHDKIASKKTDAAAWREKAREWDILRSEFNSGAITHRTTKELKLKYDGLKKSARKRSAPDAQIADGCGLPHKHQSIEEATLDKVRELLRISSDRMSAVFECDVADDEDGETLPRPDKAAFESEDAYDVDASNPEESMDGNEEINAFSIASDRYECLRPTSGRDPPCAASDDLARQAFLASESRAAERHRAEMQILRNSAAMDMRIKSARLELLQKQIRNVEKDAELKNYQIAEQLHKYN